MCVLSVHTEPKTGVRQEAETPSFPVHPPPFPRQPFPPAFSPALNPAVTLYAVSVHESGRVREWGVCVCFRGRDGREGIAVLCLLSISLILFYF